MSNSALGLSDRVRNRDNSAGLAGKGRDKKPRELKGRMKPVEATDETNFVGADGIDDALETDPDFPPSKIRLAAHTLTPPARPHQTNQQLSSDGLQAGRRFAAGQLTP